MHLCCGHLTNHKKPKKSKETTRLFPSDKDAPNSSRTHGEVKKQSPKEERRTNDASGTVSAALPSLVLLRSNRLTDGEGSCSAPRDRGALTTFGKVVQRQHEDRSEEGQDSSAFSADYDNTAILNYCNIMSPDVERSLRPVESHTSEQQPSQGSVDEGSQDHEFSQTTPLGGNVPFPSKRSNNKATMDLDSALALMKSMTSSSDDTIPAAPMQQQQQSGSSEHRTHEEHDGLKRSESGQETSRVGQQQMHYASSASAQKKTSIHSRDGVSSSCNTTDDETIHSIASPIKLFSPCQLPSQVSDGSSADGCPSPAEANDASLDPRPALNLLPANQKSDDQGEIRVKDENGSSAIALNRYYIQANTKYIDSKNITNGPQGSPSSPSYPSAGISSQPETGCRRVQERTTRTADMYPANGAQDDSIPSAYHPRTRSQQNCITPETEECRSSLTSSRDNDSSNVSLVGEGDAAGSIPNKADQFKALRLDVLKATSKLLDFVGEIWRRRESLHGKLSKINLFCLHLKTSLHELENFGCGLISDLSEEEREMTEKKLFSQMKLLQNIRNGINRYLESLEKETLSQSSEQWSDDSLKVKVGNIILLTKVIPGLVRTFGSFVDDIVKADFSSKSVVISQMDGDHHLHQTLTLQDSRPIYRPDLLLSTQDHDLKQREPDCRIDYTPIEDAPPALPPKSFQSAKTRSDSKTLYEDNCRTNSGEDHVSSESEMLSTVTVRSKDSELMSSVDALVLHHQSSSLSHPSSVVVERGMDGKAEESCGLQQPSVVFRQRPGQRISAPSLQQQSTTTIADYHQEDSHSDAAAAAANGLLEEEKRFSTSELVTPDIRSSGISLTVQTQLEELQRQAKSQNVSLHTDADCSFMDYDLPAGIMEENLPNLCESDCKLLLYYSDEMFNHWKVLDSAASAFFHCMEMAQLPKVFIMHSKFVIVAGHKMAYIGDVLARNVTDEEARDWLLAYSNDICERLKYAVRTTKGAALAFPDVQHLQFMVDAIKEVTDSAYELRELLFRLAYLGRAEQLVSW